MVTLIWTITNGGGSVAYIDHGSIPVGTSGTAREIFVRHDGVNPITNCGLYVTDYNQNDFIATLLGWGDEDNVSYFGGLQFNLDATGLYPTWPTYGDKSSDTYFVAKTGLGDSITNAVVLPITTGLATSAGVIQPGTSPNVRFKFRIQVPATIVGDPGPAMAFETRIRFTYTS